MEEVSVSRVELHIRTIFSQQCSKIEPDEYIKNAVNLGVSTVAITDLNTTRGFPQAVRSAEKQSVKLILGCEIDMLPEDDSSENDAVPVMILIRNREGLVSLNRMLTDVFLTYGNKHPFLKRSVIGQSRSNILLGSSCNHGEVYRAVEREDNPETIKKIASFYDYIEIEPIRDAVINYADEEKNRNTCTVLRQIVELGKQTDIPVVAVSNAANINTNTIVSSSTPAGNKYFPNYLLSATQMLEAFSFLEEEDQSRVVLEEPQRIADLISDHISLWPEGFDDNNPRHPSSESDDLAVCSIAREQARSLYGSPLPSAVQERLEKELGFIRSRKTGFQMKLAADLVAESYKNGESVLCRGSVASSLVAMLIGITDINPLPPHYRCPKCKKSIFPATKRKYRCGPDLPDYYCKNCHILMEKDGYHIPYYNFFGLRGERTLDIDLCFTERGQKKAQHLMLRRYGADRVCHAGTVHSREKGNGYELITGSHPGGIIVAPEGHTIKEFTPLQTVIDNGKQPRIVSHYDFNSMHDVLYKMDCLRHYTPDLLYLLKRHSKIDPQQVPLKDASVLGLFRSAVKLGIEETDSFFLVGSLGIPDFSSPKAQEILNIVQPKTVEEIIRVNGWLHGTNVWDESFRECVEEKIAGNLNCPASRDDILLDMLASGIDEENAFLIMETIRKGRLWRLPEYSDMMAEHNVPRFYIEGCQNIRYMFPKAHTVSYVLPALRIAWYKQYQPEAFYSSWFVLLSSEMRKSDYYQDCVSLRKMIEEESKVYQTNDKLDCFSEISRSHGLQLLLEMKLRGISIKDIEHKENRDNEH